VEGLLVGINVSCKTGKNRLLSFRARPDIPASEMQEVVKSKILTGQ